MTLYTLVVMEREERRMTDTQIRTFGSFESSARRRRGLWEKIMSLTLNILKCKDIDKVVDLDRN